ncbi:MAG: acetyl-CoA C-acyltransferase, partial [Planctomycetota bacterium]
MEIVIGGTVRTAIGRMLGSLSSLRAPDLGAKVIAEAIRRAGVPKDAVTEVIMGNVVSAGIGQNPARQASIIAGLDAEKTNAFTVNKVCGSGMKAVMLAAQALKCGDEYLVVAGGMESMSNGPYIIREARAGARLGNVTLVDTMVYDGLWDYYNDFHMGMTGELVAEKYGITREEADEFGLWSHQKAYKATIEGKFKNEILPIEVPPPKKGKEPIIVDKDEGIRGDTSLEKMAKLKPAFKKDGIVTAGNASQISDGAAAMVVATEKTAKELGMKVEARILAYAT